jgi:predicted phage-related endonuclease
VYKQFFANYQKLKRELQHAEEVAKEAKAELKALDEHVEPVA